MPLIVTGPTGVAVRWVKVFLTGQWLCDQLGAEGSGCGHTLAAKQKSNRGSSIKRVHQRGEGSLKAQKGGSKKVLDGKGGVALLNEAHSLTPGKPTGGQEGNPSLSFKMHDLMRFWDQDENLRVGLYDEGSPFSSFESAVRPGGTLHFLTPFLTDSLRRRSSTFYGSPLSSYASSKVNATSNSPDKQVRRSRRGVQSAKQSSAYLAMSVRPTSQNREPKTPSQTERLSGSLVSEAVETTSGLNMSSAVKVEQDFPSSSTRQNADDAGPREGLASASKTPTAQKQRSAGRKAGVSAGPTIVPPLERTSGGAAGNTFHGVKEKRPFQIPNPLEVVAGFVEEIRDMVHAASGKKRPPTKESVAAWEEKALAKSLLRKKHASLVLFYSKKCQLCKSMTPMVNDMARKESWWLDVCYVDVDNQNWMPEVVHYDITYVPCFMYLTPSGMAMAKTGAPLSKSHVLDGLQKVMSGTHPECKLARQKLAEKVRTRQMEAYAKAKAEWEAQKKENDEKGQSEEKKEGEGAVNVSR